MIYDKSSTTIDQQIARLLDRGMIISDIQAAKKHLSHISYYRLIGYWWSMYEDKETHIFKKRSRFEDVLALPYNR